MPALWLNTRVAKRLAAMAAALHTLAAPAPCRFYLQPPLHVTATRMSAPPARLARRLAAKRLPVLNISQRPFSLYSAKQSDPQRQQITLSRGGDGKKWAGLSTTQKAGRAASTGANLLTIIVGVGLTVSSSVY